MDLIGVLIDSNNYVEDLGKTSKIFIVLIDLEREVKEDFVFVMRVKTHILNVLQKRNLFN